METGKSENKSESIKRRKLNISFNRLFLEFFSILVAISLALAANEWRQHRNDQALVKRIIESMISEIKQNQLTVKASAEYRSKLINNLKTGNHVITKFPYRTDLTKNETQFERDFLKIASRTDVYVSKEASLTKVGEGQFIFRNEGKIYGIKTQNDSITITGEGNIQLRSAEISNTTWEVAQATQALVNIDYEVVTLFSEIYQKHNSYNKTTDYALDVLYSNGNGSILSILQDMHWYETILLKKYEEMLRLVEAD